MGVQGWTYVIVGLSFGLYLLIAWLSRVRDTAGFYVAGRGVPGIANGMATAADWMSAASFLSMTGMIATMGFAGGQYLMGWTGGYVLLALLLAPYLRKFGHFTVPDFVGDRYSSNVARLVAVVCAIFVSFTYVAGQMQGVGIVFARFLEVDINTGVVIGMAVVFIYATLGGMKGITWTQVAQYWVLITAFLIPAIAISIKLTGQAVPQVGMGSALTGEGVHLLDKLDRLNTDLGFASYTGAFGFDDPVKLLNVFCVTLALMAGTAGLPHVIVRFYTVKSVKAARWSAFWALFFIAMLYLTAPAAAAFARYHILDKLEGKTAEELPDWFWTWETTRLVVWLDDGDGVVRYSGREDNELLRADKYNAADWAALRVEHQRWLDGTGGRDIRPTLRSGGMGTPHNDIIVLAAPEMAELADWMVALVAAGGLAAALSTASGLLLVISSSVAHDLYYRVINPKATEAQRLIVGRVVIGLAVVVAGIFGIYPPGFVSEVVAFAFGLACASFFPAIVLGIFSTRVSTWPAVIGMVVGISFTALYIFGVKADTILGHEVAQMIFGASFWRRHWFFGIGPQGIGAVGMMINFAVTLALTPLFAAPSPQVQQMVESIREPEGAPPAVAIETIAEH